LDFDSWLLVARLVFDLYRRVADRPRPRSRDDA